MQANPALVLPALRADLALLPGSAAEDGSPTWLIHDVCRNRYFKVGLDAFRALKHWQAGLAASDFMTRCEADGVAMDEQDLQGLLQFVQVNQLMELSDHGSVQRLTELHKNTRQHWFKWLLHHYLFIKIPLWRPDAFLDKTWPMVSRLLRPGVLWTVRALGLVGMLMVLQQWDVFLTTFLHFLSWQGLALYGLTLAVVKSAHELGHAYMAKKYGCKVGSIGVAFLLLFPVLYTDTTDAWRLRSNRDRLRIVVAGVGTELHLAMLATFAWSFLPDGPLRSVAFFVATTSWVTSLLVNLSPFMRFDGYFILCDALDMPNLHQRSFALARWKMREWLFGLNEQAPEIFTPVRQKALLLMAFATWTYRLVLFLGIALMVYHMFTKLLGSLLFFVEIYWFIWYPVRSELKEWWQRRQAIRTSRRSRYTVVTALIVLLLVGIPLPAKLTVSALLKPSQLWPVHAPGPAYVLNLHVKDGQEVAAGQSLISLQAPDVQMQLDMNVARWQSSSWKSATSSVPDASNLPMALSHAQLDVASAELNRMQEQAALYNPIAPFAGRFLLSDPDMAKGQWLDKKEKVGVLIGHGPWRVETWLDESQVQRIRLGTHAHFLTPGLLHPLSARVVEIEADSSRTLEDGQLTANHGGHIVVREQSGQWWPEQAVYRYHRAVAARGRRRQAHR